MTEGWRECGRKVRFATEEDALHNGAKYGGQRAYHCYRCEGFHLTTSPDRPPPPPKKPTTIQQEIRRAEKALAELDKKGVQGALRETAEKHLSDLNSKLRGF